MSWFIFNDIHSDDMVRVESLPPIVKPPLRYNQKEVDGNSITNIEFLGYKTYTKSIKLWFKENDIQNNLYQVMDWLSGRGKLILSNEPDKYYDAYILEQINYEKAIRYKKATVDFLVQPYKYYLEEEETISRIVFNQGNTNCLPCMTIKGAGTVNLLINGAKACSLTIDGEITLDSSEQEAYKGAVLKNRFMIGNFPELLPGENTISFTGSGVVTEVRTLVRSRWL